MSIAVVSTTLKNNLWSGKIDKIQDIIGLDGLGLNLEIKLRATGSSALPATIQVKIDLKEPGQGGKGKSSLAEPMLVEAFPFGGTGVYRLDVPAWMLATKLVAEGRREFATLVRASVPGMPATADQAFKNGLQKGNWALRGMGKQGVRAFHKNGDINKQRPDAKQLMRAGGVEVLEISVVPQPRWQLLDAKTLCFLRSPADIFFYTGHGVSNLVTHGGAGPRDHDDFMKPEELVQAWSLTDPVFGRNLLDVDVLIVNGCSVLSCSGFGSSGMDWAKLLISQGGPLYALLGYKAGSPSDSRGGAAVAGDFAKLIAGGLDDNWLGYAKAWLEVNKKNHALFPSGDSGYTLKNACAIDLNGYWEFDGDLKIVGPNPLPKKPTT